jgi:hypothetical protein
MMSDRTDVSGVLTDALARGTVHDIGPDGSVMIDGVPDRLLDVLIAGQGEVQLARGDEVVYWLPGDATERGVVFGRIGGTAAKPVPPQTLTIEAGSCLTLRVGESSIEIRADGKILIKGHDLVSHAKRVNRIKGGAVSIN